MSGLPKVTICELFGVSRQSYYRKKWRATQIKARATEVVENVEKIRAEMPRIGCRKLYYMLKPQMRSLSVGRDKMFSILRANHMLVSPVRSYHVTTNSHHRFRKHKNLVDGMEIVRPEQVCLGYGFGIYFPIRDSTFYASHGGHHSTEAAITQHIARGE